MGQSNAIKHLLVVCILKLTFNKSSWMRFNSSCFLFKFTWPERFEFTSSWLGSLEFTYNKHASWMTMLPLGRFFAPWNTNS